MRSFGIFVHLCFSAKLPELSIPDVFVGLHVLLHHSQWFQHLHPQLHRHSCIMHNRRSIYMDRAAYGLGGEQQRLVAQDPQEPQARVAAPLDTNL